MVEQNAAVKLSKEVLANWTGPVWYISLIKGPDILDNICAALIRFWQGVFAALGDIKKMYNSVWLDDREGHHHRFWRDSEEADIQEYAITRVKIGDKPAGCFAPVTMCEKANLPIFNHLAEECHVLGQDAYVDTVLTSHNDLSQLKQITANIEQILEASILYMKLWVYSGQSGRPESKSLERK